MFYADVLGISGLAGMMISGIDTLPEILTFIVCLTWAVIRVIYFAAKLVFYIIESQQRIRREAFDQRQREGLNGKHQSR